GVAGKRSLQGAGGSLRTPDWNRDSSPRRRRDRSQGCLLLSAVIRDPGDMDLQSGLAGVYADRNMAARYAVYTIRPNLCHAIHCLGTGIDLRIVSDFSADFAGRPARGAGTSRGAGFAG